MGESNRNQTENSLLIELQLKKDIKRASELINKNQKAIEFYEKKYGENAPVDIQKKLHELHKFSKEWMKKKKMWGDELRTRQASEPFPQPESSSQNQYDDADSNSRCSYLPSFGTKQA